MYKQKFDSLVKCMEMLTDDIAKYVHDLKLSFPSITNMWLLGSRANGTAGDDSDWDFLVFSSSAIYEAVKKSTAFHREDIDLLLVGEDGDFSQPFGKPKDGSLEKWKWKQVSEVLSHYEGCKWVPDMEAAAEGMDDMGDLVFETLNSYQV